MIVVNAKSPCRKLNELIGSAQAKPGEMTIASTRIRQDAIEQLKRAAKADITHVP